MSTTKGVTKEQRERMELVRECRKLADLLQHTYKDFNTRVSENADGTFSCEPYDCRDERCISIDWDGNVKLTTWQTSGHNGDPYGEETKTLDPAHAKQELVGLKNLLMSRAVDAEKRFLEEAKKQKVDDVATANVMARLR